MHERPSAPLCADAMRMGFCKPSRASEGTMTGSIAFSKEKRSMRSLPHRAASFTLFNRHHPRRRGSYSKTLMVKIERAAAYSNTHACRGVWTGRWVDKAAIAGMRAAQPPPSR